MLRIAAISQKAAKGLWLGNSTLRTVHIARLGRARLIGMQ
jgi:hypothetical protein